MLLNFCDGDVYRGKGKMCCFNAMPVLIRCHLKRPTPRQQIFLIKRINLFRTLGNFVNRMPPCDGILSGGTLVRNLIWNGNHLKRKIATITDKICR